MLLTKQIWSSAFQFIKFLLEFLQVINQCHKMFINHVKDAFVPTNNIILNNSLGLQSIHILHNLIIQSSSKVVNRRFSNFDFLQ